MFNVLYKAVNWFYYRTLFSLKSLAKCPSDSCFDWEELQQTRQKLIDLRFKKVKLSKLPVLADTCVGAQDQSTISDKEAQAILLKDLQNLSLSKHKLISDPLLFNHIQSENKNNVVWLQDKYVSNK